ncbi:MAG: hypothetical protein J6K42_05005 [Clostridia bacterium]|nr:hypothetical protein [Clostridia bacterium]
MSKYLCVGLAKQITVEVKDEKMAKKVELDFFEKVERSLYNVQYETEKNKNVLYIIFNLKDDMIAKYAMDLFIEQHEKYIKSYYSNDAIEYYKNIKNKDKKEILNLINTENNPYIYNFRLGWFGFDASYLFKESVYAYITEFLTFHCSEKTYMEVYSTFFRYMRNVLVNSTDNPLKTALAVSL